MLRLTDPAEKQLKSAIDSGEIGRDEFEQMKRDLKET